MDSPRFAMIPIEALHDRRLTYRQLVVLCALCSFRSDAKSWAINPKRQAISERCGLHPSVISSATSDLCGLGWLFKDGKGGYSRSTRYVITIPTTVANTVTVADSVTVTPHATVTEYATGSSSVTRNTQRVTHSATRKEERDLYKETKENVPDAFADFWQQYPKKAAKPDAMKAWRKLKPSGQLLVDLMAGLAIQKVSDQWRKNGGEFIPHPATWLNKRRWEDEIQAAQSAYAENSLFAGAL